MNAADLLADGFARIRGSLHEVVDGLSPDQLAFRLEERSNSIAWLVWHLTRVQDDHVADVAGSDQVWRSEGWSERFSLPFDEAATGYGHSSADVAAVRVDSADLLTGYYDAVHERTLSYVSGLSDQDLDRVVDERWDPPVTLGARLVSVVNDDMQHIGQAAFLRGVLP
jgi:uncharacterized damage-inducible protein DinB